MIALFLFRRLALTQLLWALGGPPALLVVTAHLLCQVWLLLGRLLLVAVTEQFKTLPLPDRGLLVVVVATILAAS
jgi:hypothetical protein